MNVALYAMNSLLKLFPSVGSLDAEMRERIESLFEIYDSFNLGQMLQGENLPFHLDSMRASILEVRRCTGCIFLDHRRYGRIERRGRHQSVSHENN